MKDADEDEPIRGQVRLVGHRRVSHGLYLKDLQLDANDEFRRDLRAWRAVLPKGVVFTHVTGARLRGWTMPKLPEQVPIFAAVSGDVTIPRRLGLICSRLVRETEPTLVKGLPVDSSEEILLRAARDLGVLDLAIMIDSALALGDLDPKAMEALLATSRPGVRILRTAYELATARCESGGETVLRMFHEAMEIRVRPQVELYDSAGQLLGRADLLVAGTNLVHEYDGAGHRDGGQHRSDLRRERALAAAGYTRRGFVLDDLLNHPGVVMHELDRSLRRPHDAGRLARWRRVVENSLYGEPGRQRILNRWRRAMGFDDWGRTARAPTVELRSGDKPQNPATAHGDQPGFQPQGP